MPSAQKTGMVFLCQKRRSVFAHTKRNIKHSANDSCLWEYSSDWESTRLKLEMSGVQISFFAQTKNLGKSGESPSTPILVS